MGKNKKKGGKNQADDADDDWEALLEAEASKNKQAPPPAETQQAQHDESDDEEKEQTTKSGGGLDAAAAFLAAQGLADNSAEKSDAKKKRKKKKPVGGGSEAAEEPKKEEGKISARGKLVAERLRLQREEEERIRLAEEAERKRIADLEAAEEAERLRIEAEKEKKRLKKQQKIEQQKKEGTYMTKAQKQKAALAQQRLEAMKAAGMVVGPTNDNEEKKKSKVVYDKKKKNKKVETAPVKKEVVEEKPKPVEEDEEDDWEKDADTDDEDSVKKPEPTIQKPETKPPITEKSTNDDKDDKDEWDASGDEWDADSDDGKLAELEQRLQNTKIQNEFDEEDLEQREKRLEQERLKQLGLERQERERLEAQKRAELLAEQQELERQEQLKIHKREEGRKKREQQEKENLAARTRDNLRCPIVVIMGHVDTGKTKLLDKIRKTNVQLGEAGGITQQIGATYFEKKTLETQTAKLNETEKFDIQVPGMLVIDTPGHESFTNLRSRGSSLCDVAILVVDLMHGLEQQTKESLKMLVDRGTPFVVALNKVDRCYSWKSIPDSPIRESLKIQPEGTISEFRQRALEAKVQLQELGVNSNIYWEMGDDDWENSDFVPIVPTSAITGEGVQDLLLLLCQISQRKLWRQIMWHANLQCTVLEVKAIDGLGMTVDVLVVNGYLREGDRAVFCTLDGPIVTEIRGLLTPPPSREMRVKADYIHHKEIKGALGVKVIGHGLEKVMAGTPVLTLGPDDEEEDIKAEVMSDLSNLQDKLSVDKKGVMVQASTLGALEALLQFLREETKPPIPVSSVGIGTIHKKDVTKISIMNEKGCPEFATILAFDVDINPEAREHAQEMGVRIFTADIIYHLFDQFTRFMENLREQKRQDAAAVAVFPSIIRILPQHIFNQKDPIIVGVEVVEGILKVGTPLCVPQLGGLHVGKVTSIESNGKEQETARKGSSVAVKIVNETNPTITYGRQFDSSHPLYSTLSRASIDALKENFQDKLETEDWRLVIKLKKVFNII
jgi:translation initiation factor 5B